MVLLDYIIIYYITKLGYSRLLLFYYVINIYLVLFLSLSVCFHLRSPISFTFTFQTVIVFIIFITLYLANSLEPKNVG